MENKRKQDGVKCLPVKTALAKLENMESTLFESRSIRFRESNVKIFYGVLFMGRVILISSC